jgi:DNA-binding NarL/FixJ family response regulator
MSRDRAITVVIVDDHPALRDGIRAGLEREGSTSVVGEASDGIEAVGLVANVSPDVVLMDLQLPSIDGVEAIRRIVARAPDVKILVLTVLQTETNVIEAIRAGASGYLLKTATTEEIVAGVRRAYEGDAVFTPALAGLVLSDVRARASSGRTEGGLTPREMQVLRLVAQGHSYSEIAAQLFISPKTARNHVQNILRKLRLGRRFDLMRYAIERGLDRPG